jgi:hypothetical protein
MNLTNLLGLPDAFVAAVKNDPYTGGGDISVTKLIDAPQRRVLYGKYKDFVVEDVSDRVWAVMGQAVHTVLERAGTSALVEERLFMDVNGWKLSGQFDRLHVADKTIQDWKVTTTYKADGDESWTRQLNILRMLAIHNGHDIERLQVVAIFRDWQRSKAERDEKYPQSNVKIIEIPVWDNDFAMAYIAERVGMHQAAVNGDEVQCSDEERWYAGSTFALMKEGNKRATKVADTREELGEPAKGFFIEERKGGYRRCEGYCEVAPFCPQLAREREQQEKANA